MHYFIILFFIFLIKNSALADELYPKCSGEEIKARAVGGQSKLLTSEGRVEGQTLIIECLAFQVTSLSPEGICNIPHQTNFPFRLFVRAKGTYKNNDPYIDEFDVRDVVGGSINALTISTPTASSFELFFSNEHSNKDCMLNIRAIFVAKIIKESDYPWPSIVNIDPPTVYGNSKVIFVAKHSSSNDINHEKIFIVPVEKECSDKDIINLSRVTDAATISEYTLRYGALANRFSVWNKNNIASDNYKICSSYENRDKVIASLTVFGGNPAYFVILKGADKDGKIYTHTDLLIKFVGYNLDSRPFHDQAKLVDEESTCDKGLPAGGVPLATNLGPDNDWGPETTYTTWKLMITGEGGFKICYKRYLKDWVEVPSINDIPYDSIQYNTTLAPVPQPTFPKEPHDNCPIAKARNKTVRGRKTIIKVNFGDNHIPSFFRALISEALCVPVSSIIIYPSPKSISLYLDIECLPDQKCNGEERKDFFLELYEASKDETTNQYPRAQVEAFNDLNILKIKEVANDGIFIFEDSNVIKVVKGKSHFLVAVLVCFTIIVVIGIIVYGFLQYRKNQHHFIQFGLDDDEEEQNVEITGPENDIIQIGKIN